MAPCCHTGTQPSSHAHVWRTPCTHDVPWDREHGHAAPPEPQGVATRPRKPRLRRVCAQDAMITLDADARHADARHTNARHADARHVPHAACPGFAANAPVRVTNTATPRDCLALGLPRDGRPSLESGKYGALGAWPSARASSGRARARTVAACGWPRIRGTRRVALCVCQRSLPAFLARAPGMCIYMYIYVYMYMYMLCITFEKSCLQGRRRWQHSRLNFNVIKVMKITLKSTELAGSELS